MKCFYVTHQPAVLDACLCLCVGYPEAGGTGSEELPDVAAGTQVPSKDSIFFQPHVWYLRIIKAVWGCSMGG